MLPALGLERKQHTDALAHEQPVAQPAADDTAHDARVSSLAAEADAETLSLEVTGE